MRKVKLQYSDSFKDFRCIKNFTATNPELDFVTLMEFETKEKALHFSFALKKKVSIPSVENFKTFIKSITWNPTEKTGSNNK